MTYTRTDPLRHLPPATARLLHRFLGGLHTAGASAAAAVWAHGSLGGGDYQEGRSDLDLLAVLPGPLRAGTAWRLALAHARLRTEPLAPLLHCTYLTPGTAGDPGRRHLTWAHGRLLRRTVTPVTRRELHSFGLVLHGRPPSALLPPVTDADLAAFVVRDQRDFWRPALDRAVHWTLDVWVDLGLVTYARARVTLEEGRLITKREALDLLPRLGAPAEVVADIRARRYGPPSVPGEEWRVRRAELTRAFLTPAVDRLVAAHS